MKEINVYLAHYGNTRLFAPQVSLIRHFFRYDKATSVLQLFGFVDAPNDADAEAMRAAWVALGVTPIDLPRNRADYFAVSYGLAFQHVYETYIKHDTHVSVFLENDMFPIDFIDVEAYCEPYKMCGDIRFNTAQLPDRMVMFYLGLQIFNHRRMTDKDMFGGRYGEVRCVESGAVHHIDCGGESYNWLKHNDNWRDCKHIPTVGPHDPAYSPFTAAACIVHNVTTDVEHLPAAARVGYLPSFRSVNYDGKFLHLERMNNGYMSTEEIMLKTLWVYGLAKRIIECT